MPAISTALVEDFVRHALTIPLLPNRISLNSLTFLVSSLPVGPVTQTLATGSHFTAAGASDSANKSPIAHLLANLLALTSKRVPHLSTGKDLKAYLDALTNLQDALVSADARILSNVPQSVLASFVEGGGSAGSASSSAAKGKGRALPTSGSSGALRAAPRRIEDDEDHHDEDAEDSEGDKQMTSIVRTAARSSSSPKLDEATYKRLLTLPSTQHVTSIIAQSNRFSASTRPALFRFLCSTLNAGWPTDVRDRLLSNVLFSQVGSASAAGAAGSRSMAGGLIREIWRGWIRSSSLVKRAMAADSSSMGTSASTVGGTRDLLNTLTDPDLAQDWPALVLLCELYSRTLLTIGDDEFYADAAASSSAVRATTAVSTSSRNPLSLDEVVSLSAVLRNLCFAMFWFEGSGPLADLQAVQQQQGKAAAANGLSKSPATLAGMRLSLLSLRSLLTKLLQQLYARDSRRPFTPTGHWLMLGQQDMQTFVQTAVMEETELAGPSLFGGEDRAAQGGGIGDRDGDGDVSMRATAVARREAEQDEGEENDGAGILPLPVSGRIRARRGRTKNLTARTMAFLSPRLGVLNNVPFVIPFDVRVEIFRQFIRNDIQRLGIDRHSYMYRRRPFVKIRRGHISEDGFAQLNLRGDELKHPLQIMFLDEWGNEEAGIDGGGLFKEFLTSLIKEVFDTDRGLWRATDEQEIYPNPHSYAQTPDSLEWYTFLGRILGKAIYEGILVDVKFASFFLSKWLGKQTYLDDLASLDSLDKELYKGLIYLKNYTGDVEADLALNFTVTDEEFGVQHTTELIPNGSNIPVTKENRLSYIYRVSHYRLTAQIAPQARAFFTGLSEVVDPRWLRMMNKEELRVLVSGTDSPIDVDDLKANTVLAGYHEKDEVVEFFWNAVKSFDQDTRRALLKFVTSCPSPPLLGFSQLNPKFAIQHSSDDESRLPSSSTCVNLLRLPRYSSQALVTSKLKMALEEAGGFHLS